MVALLSGRTLPMGGPTAKKVRRRSAGEGTIYPRTDGGHSGRGWGQF